MELNPRMASPLKHNQINLRTGEMIDGGEQKFCDTDLYSYFIS